MIESRTLSFALSEDKEEQQKSRKYWAGEEGRFRPEWIAERLGQ